MEKINKKAIFKGLVFGLVIGIVGSFLVLQFFTDLPFYKGYKYIKTNGALGKVLSLGAIPNLILFFILLKKNKDVIARGVVLSMFVLIIISLLL